MMRRIVWTSVALLVVTLATVEAGELQGVWTATDAKEHSGKMYFSLQTDRHDHHDTAFERSAFHGLSASDVTSDTRVPVEFELQREAGTIHFEGSFREGKGGGDFTFRPNAGFAQELRAAGVRYSERDLDEDGEMLNLALFDVSIPFIRSMQAIGYDETLDKYVAFRIFGVDPGYVHDMDAVGFKHLSADKLTETRIHGATPDYIRTMRKGGEDLTLDQYIESRIFQVTPEFADEMAQAGYPNLKRDMLVQFRIHNVNPDFVHDLSKVGYTHVPPDKLVEMRIHGVTPDFIRRVNKAGYERVPVDKLVQMRIFHIEPEMVRDLDDAAH
jgi:hypothetical protein